MEWWALLAIFFGAFLTLLVLRVPIAVALLALNVVGVIYFYGLEAGLRQVSLSMVSTLATFSLVPVPLFILMGEILFKGEIADRAVKALDRQFGRLPARMPIIAIATGTLFAALSGSNMANTALLGRSLLPGMTQLGYSHRLSMGSILASSGLAMVMPPSALAVVWAATAKVPVGPLLIAGLLPALLMAANYVIVAITWDKVTGGATAADSIPATFKERWQSFSRDLFPLIAVIILVVGSIFSGLATPTESAALGALGSVALLAIYGRLNARILWRSLVDTARVTGMVFFILVGSAVYSQLMSFSGATSGATRWLTGLPLPPLGVLIVMMLGVVILGLFIEQISIMMVTLPLFMPVVHSFGWDPLWFGIVMLVTLQIAHTTPPFGLGLFIMKSVAPKETLLTDVYKGALPFLAGDIVSIAVVLLIPQIVLFLPQAMGA